MKFKSQEKSEAKLHDQEKSEVKLVGQNVRVR